MSTAKRLFFNIFEFLTPISLGAEISNVGSLLEICSWESYLALMALSLVWLCYYLASHNLYFTRVFCLAAWSFFWLFHFVFDAKP